MELALNGGQDHAFGTTQHTVRQSPQLCSKETRTRQQQADKRSLLSLGYVFFLLILCTIRKINFFRSGYRNCHLSDKRQLDIIIHAGTYDYGIPTSHIRSSATKNTRSIVSMRVYDACDSVLFS